MTEVCVNVPVASVLRKLLLSWLTAVTVCWLLLPKAARSLEGTEALAELSMPWLLSITGIGTAALLLLGKYRNTAAIERWGIFGVFVLLAVLSLTTSFRWQLLAACVLGIVVLLGYCRMGWDWTRRLHGIPRERQDPFKRATAFATVLFFLTVSAWGLGRFFSFGTPTYDFGIFSQMFHSMRTAGSQVTTLERETALSHFKVHVSPVYYLMLPVYCLVPHPAVLQVLQAAVLASSVIPMWKLGRLHGLPTAQRMLLCMLLLFYPAFAGGTGYDLHENCFLTPFLLWMFYGADRKKPWLTALFGFLVLTVKEDAAVYSGAVALWLALRGILYRERLEMITGAGMLLGSVLWFLGATGYLASFGDGVMTYRYQNLIYDGSGSLLSVVKAVLLCPMKAVYECTDPEKLWYIVLSLLPLLGLPLLTRRYERYLLLIPWLLVNLLSDYEYQHSIFFQYNFGSLACLLYLTAVNLGEIRDGFRRFLLLLAASMVSMGFFCGTVLPEAVRHPINSIRYQEYYGEIREVLEQIPEEASVAASTFYTAELSQRELLYDIRYASLEQILSAEYLAIDPNGVCGACRTEEEKDGIENLLELLKQNGYHKVAWVDGAVAVYRK